MLKSTLAKVILTGSLLLAGGGFLVYSSLDDAQYYEMVDKVAKHPSDYLGKDLKLHGYVEAGSIKEPLDGPRTFVLQKDGERIAIEYPGDKPGNLKDRAEVVAHGKLEQRNGQLVMVASDLMAKCPSKYQGAQSNRNMF